MRRTPAAVNKLFFLTPLVALLVLSACAGGYGRMDKRPEVTQSFLEQRLPSDYRFFYIGRETMPYAIIGIRNEYQLASKFWKPVDPGSEAFQKMVRTPYGYQENPVRGAFLISPDGDRVGLWYSAYDFARFRVAADKQVYVFNPYSPTDNVNGQIR